MLPKPVKKLLLYTAEHPVSSRSGESAAFGRPQSGCDTRDACNASDAGGPQRRRRRRRGAGPVETTKYVFAIGSRLDEVLDVIERDDADAILVPFLNISGRQVPWSKVEIALCELGAGRRA